MTDKKSFGAFIKSKRTERGYSQKDLAEMLFVTEGAVSKWERGVSYPDITLISDICRVLEISEHELITASTDTDARKMKHEARQFRVIRSAWFWVPTLSYASALLVCFICNLAVDHTLSWFFIVWTALICAYSFIPSFTFFFPSKKLLAFSASTYLSICLLLFACAVYTNGFSWFLTACIGILIGYAVIFLPILLSRTALSRYKFILSFTAAFVLTVFLLLNIHVWHSFSVLPAILITCYAFLPVMVCAVICALRFDAFLKTGICIALSTVVYYFTNAVVDQLFGTNNSSYRVNFHDWQQCSNGNVHLISLLSLLLIGVLFLAAGMFRLCKRKDR